MSANYDVALNLNPDASGNMYFRGEWEYNPEYKTGDVVAYNGKFYIARKHHASKPPDEKESAEYWQRLGVDMPPPPEPRGRIMLCGGFASTPEDDYIYLNGGNASERIHIPLT